MTTPTEFEERKLEDEAYYCQKYFIEKYGPINTIPIVPETTDVRKMIEYLEKIQTEIQLTMTVPKEMLVPKGAIAGIDLEYEESDTKTITFRDLLTKDDIITFEPVDSLEKAYDNAMEILRSK